MIIEYSPLISFPINLPGTKENEKYLRGLGTKLMGVQRGGHFRPCSSISLGIVAVFVSIEEHFT